MQGSTWGVSLRNSQFFLSLCLSMGLHGNFLVFPYMKFILNVLIFNICLPKGEKERNEKARVMGTSSWNSLEVHSSGGEGTYNGGGLPASVSAPLWSEAAIRLPWWCSGWESACQCRGHGFKPWSGKMPHAAEQLIPCATTAEPARLEPVLRNKRGCDSERPAHCDEEWPPLAATRESPHTETKTQHSQ